MTPTTGNSYASWETGKLWPERIAPMLSVASLPISIETGRDPDGLAHGRGRVLRLRAGAGWSG